MGSKRILMPYLNIGSWLCERDFNKESEEIMLLMKISFLSSKSTDNSLTILSSAVFSCL